MGYIQPGYTPFTKKGDGKGLMQRLKELRMKLQTAKPKDKSKIKKQIEAIQNKIEDGYNKHSQLNPNNPDRD
tara:strand:+ start:161 stop:376 length:216 start_codon:yes stop_codon:yes gene_type:complete